MAATEEGGDEEDASALAMAKLGEKYAARQRVVTSLTEELARQGILVAEFRPSVLGINYAAKKITGVKPESQADVFGVKEVWNCCLSTGKPCQATVQRLERQ